MPLGRPLYAESKLWCRCRLYSWTGCRFPSRCWAVAPAPLLARPLPDRFWNALGSAIGLALLYEKHVSTSKNLKNFTCAYKTFSKKVHVKNVYDFCFAQVGIFFFPFGFSAKFRLFRMLNFPEIKSGMFCKKCFMPSLKLSKETHAKALSFFFPKSLFS